MRRYALNTVCIYSKKFAGGNPPEIVEDSSLPLPAVEFEMPFMKGIGVTSTIEEGTERFKLGRFGAINITRDCYGCVYAADKRLSGRKWVSVGDVFLLARPAQPASVQPEPGFSRFWRGLRRRDCAHCDIFDRDEGVKWRHAPTHSFDDGSTASMWDDVMNIVADDAGVNVIPDKHIGYCRVREAIVDGRNRPCKKFRRC